MEKTLEDDSGKSGQERKAERKWGEGYTKNELRSNERLENVMNRGFPSRG